MKQANNLLSKESGLVAKLKEMVPINWEFFRYLGSEPIPHHLSKWWFCLGGTVLYLFIIQVLTGIMLTFYYVPSPPEAYHSVSYITNEVRFGWFIRSLHKWSSNFMVVALILHMLRVYFTGAYRHPRQINWMVGFLLFGLTMAFAFTGYSLIFEQLSYWGATVATNLIEAVPFLGPTLALFVRGGPEFSANTITRFFIFHVGILPTLTFILLAIHIILIRTHGVTELYFEGETVPEEKKTFKFWPDHATTEIMIGVLLLYLLTILALVFPAELGEMANPNVTPPHIKPEWYFYANFKLLKLTSLRVSVLSTMVMTMVFLFWPFIEEFLQKRFKIPEVVSVLLGIVAFLAFLVLTVWESMV